MDNKILISKKIILFIPIIGIIVFVILYIFSSSLYPGGSQADLNSVGFDWVNNYWCNLMNEKAMNGQVNPARSFAISAMIILCLSLMVFFIQFAQIYASNNFWKQGITISGILSMTFASLIFTQFHDLMTIISSIFGFFVVLGILKEIYSSDLTLYKISGGLCILLLAMNNYIYYTEQYIKILPLLQKFTFAIVLAWIVGLNYTMITKRKLP